MDASNKERTFVLWGRASALPGLMNAQPGTPVTLWLVGDGRGNALVCEPGGRPVLGRITALNDFELRATA